MRGKKLCIVLAVAAALAVSGLGIYFGAASRGRVSGQAAETAVGLYDQIFGEYYRRTGWTARLTDRRVDGGNVEEYFVLEVRHVLDVGIPDDLDYCQGMLGWCEENNVPLGRIQDTARYRELWYDMENGRDFTVNVKVSYPKGEEGSLTVLVENGEGYVPFEELAPDDEFSWESGYRYMEEVFGDGVGSGAAGAWTP